MYTWQRNKFKLFKLLCLYATVFALAVSSVTFYFDFNSKYKKQEESIKRLRQENERLARIVRQFKKDEYATQAAEDRDRVYTIVKVFYGTDRNQTGYSEPKKVYGNDRGNISYGYCNVSIPKDHRMGELEKPSSFWKIKLREKPEKHVVLLDVKIQAKDDFFA